MSSITKEQLLPLLLDTCPSFSAACAESVAEFGPELLYIHAGEFAYHLLQLHRAGQREEFPAVGSFIERLHSDGDDYVSELAAIGFIEGIQNLWSNNGSKPEEFLAFLGPLGAASWHALNEFWSGEWTCEIPFAPNSGSPSSS